MNKLSYILLGVLFTSMVVEFALMVSIALGAINQSKYLSNTLFSETAASFPESIEIDQTAVSRKLLQAVNPADELVATGCPPNTSTARKSKLTAFLLNVFLGNLGADSWFLGYIGEGFGKFFTMGGLGIWRVIDMVKIANGDMADKTGCPLLRDTGGF